MPVVLKIEGGLGNQLFQLAAGYYLASTLKSDLHIDQYSIPLTTVHGERDYGFKALAPFQLSGSRNIRILPSLPRTFFVKIAKRSNLLKRIMIKKRMFTSNPNNLEIFRETNAADTTQEFFQIKNPVKLHGNFQSWEIVERASQFGFPKVLQLSVVPNWMEQLIREIDFENSVVLHFRVGDDTRENVNFEQPGISYYLAALELLKAKRNYKTIYILSDDLTRVQIMFGHKLDINYRYLDMPIDSSPAERLYFLSLFGGIVCANSTFCGWAAWSISNSGGEVVVPVPYADGPVLGSRDFPTSWIQLPKKSFSAVDLDYS
jgi:hypothetical protein